MSRVDDMLAATYDEQQRLAAELVGDLADVFVGQMVHWVALHVSWGWQVDEIVEAVMADFAHPATALRRRRAVEALAVALRQDGPPVGPQPSTPQEFLALWELHGTQEKAARSVSLKKTQWRRKAGLDPK